MVVGSKLHVFGGFKVAQLLWMVVVYVSKSFASQNKDCSCLVVLGFCVGVVDVYDLIVRLLDLLTMI